MSNIVVGGQELPPPVSMVIENFHMSGVARFKNDVRKSKRVTELILHETITSSSKATVDVLKTRNLGVHFIVGSDGTVRQHGDLLDDELWHASAHNGPSVGIEVVNPYYPRYRPTNSPWSTIIDAPWAHEGKYVVPTPDQAESCYMLVSWLCSDASGPLEIPLTWIGLKDKKLWFGALQGADHLNPGIYAHHYFGHADGCWLVLYCWLRIEAGLAADVAYREAVSRSTGHKAGWLDVSDLVQEVEA